MTRHLRDFQVEAIQAVQAEWESGVDRLGRKVYRTSIVAATGLGKTDVIARMAAEEVSAGGRVLCLAHRGELLDQIIERCRLWLGELGLDQATKDRPAKRVGRVQAGRNEGQRDIVAGSIDTMRGDARRQSMRAFTLVIVDECHRVASPSYQKVLRWAGCFRDVEPEIDPLGNPLPPTRALGVTATMIRGDKLSLGDTWQSCAITRGIEWGVSHGPSGEVVDGPLGPMELSRPLDAMPHVRDLMPRSLHEPAPARIGWLVYPRGLAVVLDADLSGVKTAVTSDGGGGRDYAKAELGEILIASAEQVVKGWLEHGEWRTTMAFTSNVSSAKTWYEAFNDNGVSAKCVTGDTSDAERREVKARMMRGETIVRVDCAVGIEGFDCPAISCIIPRPTKLLGCYTQQVGRGLRRFDGNEWLPPKRDCLVLDPHGITRQNKLVTLVDLLPSAPYDRHEVDALPCEVCGGEAGQCVEGCDCERCDPGDGAPRAEKRRLIQPTFAEVDLFPTAGTATTLRWMETPGGTRFVRAGHRLVVLDQFADGSYAVGSCNAEGDKPEGRREAVGLSLGLALRIAETYARSICPNVDKPYKGAGRATPAQVAALVRLGIASQGDAEWHTGRAASDALELFWATRRLDR
jgi:superfamily II DNA or RNA helicase